MVALPKIEAIERGRILIADQRIPISATYKDQFFARIAGKQ
jgi:serine kinase of HPr protein (carbohydrate metabolism regulator)